MTATVSSQKIKTWIQRQQRLNTPSPAYLRWLMQQYKLRCEAEVLKGDRNAGIK
jgi:hypothetical protein